MTWKAWDEPISPSAHQHRPHDPSLVVLRVEGDVSVLTNNSRLSLKDPLVHLKSVYLTLLCSYKSYELPKKLSTQNCFKTYKKRYLLTFYKA